MISVVTERFRGMVFYRRLVIGYHGLTLWYEFNRMAGNRRIGNGDPAEVPEGSWRGRYDG